MSPGTPHACLQQLDGWSSIDSRVRCVQGRNVVLESKYGSPKIVNDGVTVAKEVELEDPVENIGAKLVRQARLPLLVHRSRIAGPRSGRVRGGGHRQRTSVQC